MPDPREIDAYARAREELVREQRKAMLLDALRAVPAGLGRGVTGAVGTLGELENYGAQGAAWALNKGGELLTGENPGFKASDRYANEGGTKLFPTVRDTNAISDLATGGVTAYEPWSDTGKMTKRVAEYLPGAAVATGGAPWGMVKYGVAPAIAEVLARRAARDKEIGGIPLEPIAGPMAALLTPGVINLAEGGIKRLVTPYPATDPMRTKFAKDLADEGIDLTAGQRTGAQGLKEKEAVTQAAQDMMLRQKEQFTSAALRRLGIDAKRATPDVLKKFYDDIGDVFDDLVSRNVLTVDQGAAAKAQDVLTDYMMLLEGRPAGIVTKAYDDIYRAAMSGEPISGKVYHYLHSRLGRALKSNNPATVQAAGAMRDVLDDALEATLKATGTPEDIARWSTARRQYQDFLAIEKAVSRAGEATDYGLISPAALESAVKSQSKRRFTQGQRDLGELARAGSATMRPLPMSGTPERQRGMGMIPTKNLATSGIGATAGYMMGGPPGAVVGAGVGAMVPRATRGLTMSPAGQAYLGNQLWTAPSPYPYNQGILGVLDALLAQRAARKDEALAP